MVTLIGGGPGDPELITVKGLQALQSADVVLYDRLVGDDIIALIPETAEKINVGKNSGRHPIPQNEINSLLLEKARQGLKVVRLKGGDPFVFGRGGEELETLANSDVDFRVIPGVTSAISGGAYGGIPVTHRDYASSVHIITGHFKENGKLDIDFETLAKLEGTLVFMMSVSSLAVISQGLIRGGMKGSTPAAIVENASTPLQRKFVGCLEELPEISKQNKIVSPAVTIIGGVCTLSNKLDWFSSLPLIGVKVMVTRARKNASALSARLRELGCFTVEAPCIEIVPFALEEGPLPKTLKNIANYEWLVFTSPAGVEVFFDYLSASRFDIRGLYPVKLAAVGTETKKEIEKRGLYVDFIPSEYNSKALAEGLLLHITGKGRVLIARAKAGTEEIPRIFEEKGILYDDIPLYNTVYNNKQTEKAEKMLYNGEIDYVTFTSASTVEGFVKSFPKADYKSITGICIGEMTAEAADKHGIKTIVSEETTINSMVEKLKEAVCYDKTP